MSPSYPVFKPRDPSSPEKAVPEVSGPNAIPTGNRFEGSTIIYAAGVSMEPFPDSVFELIDEFHERNGLVP